MKREMGNTENKVFEIFHEGIEQATNELEVAGRYLAEHDDHTALWATLEGIRRRLVDVQGEATACDIDGRKAKNEAARQLGQAVWRMGDRKSWAEVQNACALLGIDLPGDDSGKSQEQPEPPPRGDLQAPENGVHNADAQPKTAGDGVIGGDHETGKPVVPYKTFATLEELTRFVEKMTNTVRVIAHEEACRKGREDMEQFKEEQALKRKLLAPGEIYAELNFLEEAHEAVCEILECIPDLESELAGQVNEAATRAFSRLSMVLRWGAREREDIDASDNDRAERAQAAENSHGRVEHGAAQEGAAQ